MQDAMQADQDENCTVAFQAEVLTSFPGPAVLLDQNRLVVAVNHHGEKLRQALAEGRGLETANIADRCLASGLPALESVTLTVGASHQALDLTFLPLADGTVLILGRDVTLEYNLRSALVESRQRYKDLVEISSDFAWETGSDGRFVFVSPKGALGFDAEHLVGQRPDDFILARSAQEGPLPFHAIARVEDAELWMKDVGGEAACLLASATPILGAQGEWRGARGVCRDVTVEKMRDAALARANERERLLSHIVRTIRDVVDPVDMLSAAAAATAHVLGACGCQVFRAGPDGVLRVAATLGDTGDDSEILGALGEEGRFIRRIGDCEIVATLCRYRQAANGALAVRRPVGGLPWSEDDLLLIGDVANQIGIANEQIENHERILRLSRTDALTGLFNRRAFFEELERRYSRLNREGKSASLIYVDLDNFKWVNDQHGHQTGDEALLVVRDLLTTHTRPIDLVARLGGDEFAIWLEGADETIAIRRCQELLDAGSVLKRFSGAPDRPLHMSLGLAVHQPAHPETLHDLIERADRAMYQVKREGKGDWRLAPPSDLPVRGDQFVDAPLLDGNNGGAGSAVAAEDQSAQGDHEPV